MPEDDELLKSLSPGARRLVETAEQRQQEFGHAQLGANHWLLALVERHGPMAEDLVDGLQAETLRPYLRGELGRGNTGTPLDVAAVVGTAGEVARGRGKTEITESDLAAAILKAANYELHPATSAQPQQAAVTAPSSAAPTGADPTTTSEAAYRPRPTRPTPTLEQYGRDLTRQALEGKLTPVVGRDEEVQVMVETLSRRTKRNPVLIGPAGVGKTAVVEGFAQRIVRGEVPAFLRGVRVLAVQPSALVAGASMVGALEARVKALLAEASQDGIVLFIDEVHSIVGAGGSQGSGDIASLLKPALARGDLACIAATTDDEYRRFIEPDEALERRFQPIRVQELGPEQTLLVLRAQRDDLVRLRGIEVPDPVLTWLVDFAGQYMRNRYFPDKAVDLLEQCIAYALTQEKTKVEPEDAEAVAQRMIGMPLSIESRLADLKEQLAQQALIAEADAEALVNRLEVGMRGLDLHPNRPNAVVLLVGNAAHADENLAETIAQALFGSPERVVSVDFSRFVHPADVTMLIGAPPGYVGYDDALPLHKVSQTPWCVVRCENVHSAHPQVLDVLTQALGEGVLSQANGKKIYLSDAVVLLVAEVGAHGSGGAFGFLKPEDAHSGGARQAAEEELGEALVAQADIVCSEVPASDAARRLWIERRLLADIGERCLKQGLSLRWDPSLIDWLLTQRNTHSTNRDWERLLDERLMPHLIHYLPKSPGEKVKVLNVEYKDNSVHVEIYKKRR